ncbi:MAG: sigma-70 family RNA polymerase sigma factor, partial [Methylacidiphilales bacterium]|nr:sigma-70 family RNA polymerase sigma factor [Candidatus Methylacidiphilales bacterium]
PETVTAPGAKPDDIPIQTAISAHNGTSWTPERRGRMEQREYVRHMNRVWDGLQKLAETDAEKHAALSEFQQYRERYVQNYISLLQSRSGLFSSMIAGPSNFPARRQNKKSDAYQNRMNQFLAWDQRAVHAMREEVSPTPPSFISADRADATDALQQKIDAAKAVQERMKSANAIIRNKKLSDDEKVAKLAELKISEAPARQLLKPDYAGRIGFADYQLSNNQANIRRMQARIPSIIANREATPISREFEGGKIEENKNLNRIQIFFDSKPPADIRDQLKSNGFKWAPSQGAWQRQRTEAARQAVDRLFPDQVNTPTSETASESKQAEQSGQSKFLKSAAHAMGYKSLESMPKPDLDVLTEEWREKNNLPPEGADSGLAMGATSTLDPPAQTEMDLGELRRRFEMERHSNDPGQKDKAYREQKAEGTNPAQLFHENQNLADYMASRFTNIPGTDQNDRRQISLLALQKAAQTWDPNQDVPFQGYARQLMRRDLIGEYRKSRRDMRGGGVEPLSLNAKIDPEAKTPLQDQTAIQQPTPTEKAISRETKSILVSEIDKLPEQARTTAKMLLDGATGQEIGEALGYKDSSAREMGSRWIEKTLRALRSRIAEKGLSREDVLSMGSGIPAEDFPGGVGIDPETVKLDFKAQGDTKEEARDNFDREDVTSWPVRDTSHLEDYKYAVDNFDKNDPDTWNEFIPNDVDKIANINTALDELDGIESALLKSDKSGLEDGITPAAKAAFDGLKKQLETDKQAYLFKAQHIDQATRDILDAVRKKAEDYLGVPDQKPKDGQGSLFMSAVDAGSRNAYRPDRETDDPTLRSNARNGQPEAVSEIIRRTDGSADGQSNEFASIFRRQSEILSSSVGPSLQKVLNPDLLSKPAQSRGMEHEACYRGQPMG